MARDWLKAFRPASFRGVAFKVDGEGMAGARRLSISPIAYADQSVIEDMGRDPFAFPLTAYVAGEEADGEARALTSALSAKGPALLVLPMHGAVRARVQDWQRDRRKDFAGHIAFSISFLEEGLGSVPFGALAGAGPIADLLLSGVDLLGASLTARLAGLSASRATPAVAETQTVATRLAAVASTTANGNQPARAAADAVAALGALSAVAEPKGWSLALVTAWRAVALTAAPSDLSAALAIELPAAPAASAVGAAGRAAMAGALGIAVVRGDYAARQDARAAREAMAELVGPALAETGATLGDAAQAWLAGMTGEAARILSRMAADRAPLVRVETPISLTAIMAAYQLYGDGNRAQELVDRNRVATAALMPVGFEALSV